MSCIYICNLIVAYQPNLKMKNNLLFDFTVDQSAQTVFIKENLMLIYHWFGMLFHKRKFWINGGHQSLSNQKQK